MPNPPQDPHPSPPPVRRGLVFAIIGLALMMMSIDSTIVATALHSLQHDLDTTINWAGWTITAYSFGFVVMLPLAGRLSEQYGRRRVFVGSVVAFTTASLLCGLVDDIDALIALRVVQAAGGAGFTPSATGLIVDHFGKERDRAVSLFGSIFPVGAMIGPIFGGLFVTYWSWRGIFLVNVPIGIIVVALALRAIPPDRARVEPARAGSDATGMALLGSGLLAGMLAITYLGEAEAKVASLPFLVLLVVAFAAFGLFLRHIARATHPFIAPRLVYGRGFGAVNLVNAIFSGIPFGVVALIPLYATNRYGIDALRSGTLLVAQGIAAVSLSALAAVLIRRTGYRAPLYVGTLVIAIGVVLLAVGPLANIEPYTWLAGAAFLVGAGSGMLNPATRNAGLQLAPEHASTLAALRSMSMQIGSIATIAVATAILADAADPGTAQAWIYAALVLLLGLASPLIARVPEHRGAW
ncbi:MAG: MFS transporter [Burkholderiales bacterium]|nr:MFS transporter [Burkholderiales bacterium]